MARIAQATKKKGIHIRKFVYSKKKGSAYHWTRIIRAVDPTARELIARGMEKAVACKEIKYSNKKGKNCKLYDAAKKVGFDCSKLKKKTTTNCCNLVSVACRYAGLKTPKKSSATTLPKKWKKISGLTVLKYKGTKKQRGDILNDSTKPKVHTAVYLG